MSVPSSLDLRANSLAKLVNKPAMLDCMTVRSVNMDSLENTMQSRLDSLLDILDLLDCNSAMTVNKRSWANSLVKLGCSLAMLVNNEEKWESKLCLLDCNLDLSASKMDLQKHQACSLDCLANMMEKQMESVGSKVTFHLVS